MERRMGEEREEKGRGLYVHADAESAEHGSPSRGQHTRPGVSSSRRRSLQHDRGAKR